MYNLQIYGINTYIRKKSATTWGRLSDDYSRPLIMSAQVSVSREIQSYLISVETDLQRAESIAAIVLPCLSVVLELHGVLECSKAHRLTVIESGIRNRYEKGSVTIAN